MRSWAVRRCLDDADRRGFKRSGGHPDDGSSEDDRVAPPRWRSTLDEKRIGMRPLALLLEHPQGKPEGIAEIIEATELTRDVLGDDEEGLPFGLPVISSPFE